MYLINYFEIIIIVIVVIITIIIIICSVTILDKLPQEKVV